MKNLKNKSIEKFDNCQLNDMNAVAGGGIFTTTTSKNSTKSGLFDNDSQDECLCDDTLKSNE